MTKTLTILYQVSHLYRKRIFVILVSSIILAAISYAFLLQKTIVNIVEREKISKEIKAISVDVGSLEEKYFSLKNTITLDLAYAKGLKNADTVSYISKKPLTAMVSNNEL